MYTVVDLVYIWEEMSSGTSYVTIFKWSLKHLISF